MYAQEVLCTPPNNCLLICNPDFVPPETCNEAYQQNDIFGTPEQWVIDVFNSPYCSDFACWDNIYGSPDFSYTATTPFLPIDNYSMRCWAVAQNLGAAGCCSKGEGIMAQVNIENGKNYLLSYIRKIRFSDIGAVVTTQSGMSSCSDASSNNNNPSYSLENLHVRLTNASNIYWNTNLYDLSQQPASFQEIAPTGTGPSETNLTNEFFWYKVVRCFTANQDWNTLYLYPQQVSCANGPAIVQFEQVTLIEDTFMDIPTIVKPSCTNVANGVCIGWECAGITDMVFSWQFSTNNGATWNSMPDNTPQITVSPAQTTLYRLCRSIAQVTNPYITTGQACASACIDITVEVSPAEPDGDINTLEEMHCCLLETPFTQLAMQHTAPGGVTIQLPTDTLPSGIYYCHIQVNGQAPQTQKLVIIR